METFIAESAVLTEKIATLMEPRMTTILDRAIEDAKARGSNPHVIETLRRLTEEGLVDVRQLESGAFVFRATEIGLKRFEQELD